MKILKVKLLNINSLKGEFEIDFEEFLKDESLFAITGPTGAGKSTILDVITCALYGRTARLSNPNELMSRHTGESFCEVEFEVKGKIYRSSWGINRARKSPTGNFQPAKMEMVDVGSGKILESYLSKVPKVVEDISGLDFDRFIQSMMLAQGSFDAFLKARENERSTLLEKITGTHIYKQISQEVYKTYDDMKRDIEFVQASLGTIELLSKEVLEEKTKTLENSKLQKLEFDKKSAELKTIFTWLENLQKLESDNIKYNTEYELVSKEKEDKKAEFEKLELANKALNVQPFYQEKKLLTQNIEQDKKNLEVLQKEYNDLKALQELKVNEEKDLKKSYDNEKKSFDENTLKLKEVRTLQTKIETKKTSISELENKIKSNELENTKIAEELAKLTYSNETIKKELDSVVGYLDVNKKDELLKEELPLISKNIKEYKDIVAVLENINLDIQSKTNQKQNIQSEYTNLKQEFDTLKSNLELKENTYKELSSKSSDSLKKEQTNRDRIKVIDELLVSIENYTKVLVNLQNENELSITSQKEKEDLQSKIKEKQRLIEELQTHIKTLKEKKEYELLIINYEKDREKLKEGDECFLCGSREHPYIKEHISVKVDETTTLIEQKEGSLESENKSLREYELSLSKIESKLETSTLEKEKLNKTKVETEQIFNKYSFTQNEDSKVNLEEEKLALEKELNDLVKLREEKEHLQAQKDSLQKELNTKQSVLTTKEQELYKIDTSLAQLQTDQTQNTKRKDDLEKDLINYYGKYEVKIDTNFEESFSILLEKKDRYIQNENLKKEYETKLQKISIDKKESDTKLVSIDKALKSAKEELNTIVDEVKQLEIQRKNILDIEDIDTYEKQITTNFNKLSERYNNLSKEIATLNSKYESLTKQISDLTTKQTVDNTKLKELELSLLKALEENGFISLEIYEKAYLPKEQRDELSKRCKDIEDRYTQMKTLKDDTINKLKEQKELKLSERTFEEVNKELSELQSTIDELQKSIGSVEKELEINALNIKKHEDKIKELDTKKEAFKVWVKLNEMIGSSSGDKFAKFAQGITLDQLIYLANKHLEILSPRYELKRAIDSSKQLEIEIIDSFQGDVVRAVNTLSGGESFIVSLSLALGLSSLASQKISIDSLFLDEGFGTLDSDSLELALNALNQLQSSGKMVGVISHVEALKERIPLQIKVMPKGDGTSILNLN